MASGDEWKGEEERRGGFWAMFGRPMTDEERAEAERKYAQRKSEGSLRALFLPPFREDATCPKCGWKKVGADYCPGGGPGQCLDATGDTEHLHRTCKRCCYTWLEKTLTSDEEA